MMQKRDYGGWEESYWLSNGEVELVAPSEIGPRIIRYGFVGGQNVFHNFAHAMGKSGEAQWQNRGGHRLWVAPEGAVSKALDNGPISVTAEALRLMLRQPVEPESGMEKEIEVTLAPAGTCASVRHRVTNRNPWPVRFAPWALSVMRPGGVGIAGFPPRFRHDERLLPTNPLVMWGYTDFSDPRWRFTRHFVLVRQDASATSPQKTGLFNEDAWAAYSVGGELFVKRSRPGPAHRSPACPTDYPDLGCSVEIFTNQNMLELETLGPLRIVEPGRSVEHMEQWSLHRVPDLSGASDEEISHAIDPNHGV
jgi:hypothetical protein